MDDLISRQTAIEALIELSSYKTKHEAANGWIGGICDSLYKIEALPAAQPERKTGKWIEVEDYTGVEAFGFKEKTVVGFKCSECSFEVDVSERNFRFCPGCGADMRGERDE